MLSIVLRDVASTTEPMNHITQLRVEESEPGYTILMRPNKSETDAHGCHYPGDMAVRHSVTKTFQIIYFMTLERGCERCTSVRKSI